jgi:hypothetical protein
MTRRPQTHTQTRGLQPSRLTYRESDLTHRNPSATRASRNSLHTLSCSAHKRRACASVSASPGSTPKSRRIRCLGSEMVSIIWTDPATASMCDPQHNGFPVGGDDRRNVRGCPAGARRILAFGELARTRSRYRARVTSLRRRCKDFSNSPAPDGLGWVGVRPADITPGFTSCGCDRIRRHGLHTVHTTAHVSQRT